MVVCNQGKGCSGAVGGGQGRWLIGKLADYREPDMPITGPGVAYLPEIEKVLESRVLRKLVCRNSKFSLNHPS